MHAWGQILLDLVQTAVHVEVANFLFDLGNGRHAHDMCRYLFICGRQKKRKRLLGRRVLSLMLHGHSFLHLQWYMSDWHWRSTMIVLTFLEALILFLVVVRDLKMANLLGFRRIFMPSYVMLFLVTILGSNHILRFRIIIRRNSDLLLLLLRH